MRRFLAPVFRGALVLLFVFPGSAYATQVLRTSMEEMAQRSERVIHARVVGQQVEWNAQRTRVLTLTRLEILNTLKGKPEASVVVYQVGGTLDGVTYKIPGAIQFHKGEEIVFFGVQFRDMIVSYGMGLGKFVVSRSGKSAMVSPHYGDVEFMTRTSDGRIVADTAPIDGAESLKAFLSRVQKAVQGGRR